MASPQLWIVAGPNGAGKTTCTQKKPIADILPRVTFFNPDDRTLVKLRALGYQGFADAPAELQTSLFLESADEVYRDLLDAVTRCQTVGVETVLSSTKYCELVESVAKAGSLGLIYVALSSPSIAKERVAARVKRGGHGVPDEKVERRWQRSLVNLAWFAQQATCFWVVDNSNSDPAVPPLLVASGKVGYLEFLDHDVFPEMKAVLSSLPAR